MRAYRVLHRGDCQRLPISSVTDPAHRFAAKEKGTVERIEPFLVPLACCTRKGNKGLDMSQACETPGRTKSLGSQLSSPAVRLNMVTSV